MDCDAFRELIAADPTRRDAQCEQHAQACSGCRAYASRLRSAEGLIQEALRLDVAQLKHAASHGSNEKPPRFRPRMAGIGMAAALLVGLALWLGVGQSPQPDAEALVADVLEHWYQEPESWVTTAAAVTPASLADVVSGKARVDSARLGTVSYARPCYVHGQWVPHLVVQGEAGPVMVLLLADERLEQPAPLELPEEGLEGFILPLGRGSIAILGDEGEPLEPLGERLTGAVEWSI